MVPRAYDFRSLSAGDLPMIRRWLASPHVARWWGDPEEQFALISGDLDDPAIDQFVVALNDAPFAYLQCYDAAAWPENGFGPQPHGARGIDQFIGEPNLMGCGHGSALVRTFIAGLLMGGTPRVITDPHPSNARAIRAYEKAGLQRDRLVETPDGPALVMVRNA